MSDQNSSGPKRRLIVAQQPTILNGASDVSNLLNEALNILSSEIGTFKRKVRDGRSLSLAEARVLNNYIKSLTDMSREMRERDDSADLANITDAELVRMLEDVKGRAKLLPGANSDGGEDDVE